MKKRVIIIIAVCVAVIAVIAVFAAVRPRTDKNTVIHCYEFSAAYDYAVENGYEPFIIYGAKEPEFDSQKNSFTFEKRENGLYLTSYTGKSDVVYVPLKFNGETVTGIAEGAFDGRYIQEIYIPQNIRFIECGFD